MRPPLLPHGRVVRAFERAGFRVVRQGKHISMWNGEAMITIPRNNPVDPWTLRGIILDAGLTVEEFKDLL
ncbi:MAG: type II toxin-antitoxin system HicA family toxin [Elusimicrobiota bacterium]